MYAETAGFWQRKSASAGKRSWNPIGLFIRARLWQDIFIMTVRRTCGLFLTLVALFAYPLGIGLPALSIEKFGRIRESSILDGVENLFHDGQIFLGCVIGVTALILPPLKMFGLVWIGAADDNSPWRWRFAPLLTFIGRWGFLDLFVAGVL